MAAYTKERGESGVETDGIETLRATYKGRGRDPLFFGEDIKVAQSTDGGDNDLDSVIEEIADAEDATRTIANGAKTVADANQYAIDKLRHLTRDLHAIEDEGAWEDAADSDGDLYVALSSVNPDTFTDATFDNGGASVTIPSNADHGVYVRLPIAADHASFRVAFGTDFGRSKAGNLWVRMAISAPSDTYQYWWADGFTNFSGGTVKLQKLDSTTAATRFDGDLADGAVSTSKLAAGAVATGKVADGAITRPKLSSTLLTEIDDAANNAVVWHDLWELAADTTAVDAGTLVNVETFRLTDLTVGVPYEIVLNATFTVTDLHSATNTNNVHPILVFDGTSYDLADKVDIDGYSAQDLTFRTEPLTIWPTAGTHDVILQLDSSRAAGFTFIVKSGAKFLIGQGVGATSQQRTLYDHDEFPEEDDHEVNDIVAVNDGFYKLGVTDDTEPNVYEGNVGSIVFRTTNGEDWNGVIGPNHPNGFNTDGGWTVNPGNSAEYLIASNQRRIRFAVREDAYETAKGSAFVSSDLLAIKVRYPTSGEPDEEVVCAYYGRYTRNVNGADTAFLQFGHRNSVDDGNFNLYTEEAESRIECEFFTVDSNGAATTTPFLTHGVGVKHWVQWPSTDPNGQAIQALALARGNQSRLDALDVQVDGTADPIHSVRYDDTTALLAPTAGNAGAFAVSETFNDIQAADLMVIDWTQAEHLNHHDEHVLPGSSTEAGRMYVNASQFDNSEFNGEVLYALEKALQDNGTPDELNSWIVLSFVWNSPNLVVGLHLQQGGTRSNRNLKPRPGFSVTVRIFRNANILTATVGSLHSKVTQIEATLAGPSIRKGDLLGTVTGKSSGNLEAQPWTDPHDNVTQFNSTGGGWSDWLEMSVHDFMTLGTGIGLILEVANTGVTTQFSQIYVPWSDLWGDRQSFGGFWRSTGTADNDRIIVEGQVSSGKARIRVACAGADDDGSLSVYLAR